MKLCLDCRHSVGRDQWAKCAHPRLVKLHPVNPVTGEPDSMWFCSINRMTDQGCEPEGALWEARAKEEVA